MQNFRDIDCLFETNNSISILPGKSDAHAVIEDIQFASTLIANAPTEPSYNNTAALFEWLNDYFSWQNANMGTAANEIKTGKWTGGQAENGTHSHPYWNATRTANKLELWDNRNYGHK